MISKPNIILINCDDLGYGDIGCYGSTINSTPALDRMAEEGIRFTDFYMAAPVCSPSRGAMMTGCYPRRIGFGSFDGQWVLFPGQPVGLNPDEITIADLLRQQGYATKIVGKWHCGDQPEFLPTRHGFDEYFGIPYSNDMGRQTGRKDWNYAPLPLLRNEEVIQQQPDQSALTERYAEESVKFIRDHQTQPFFLYLAHMHVHLPLYAPARFIRESQNGTYGAAVACVDWVAAVLLHELAQLGIDDNTLVIFTSDNGARGDHGGSNAPLRGGKCTTWEGGMRLPCIMRWPGHIPAGTVSDAIVTSMDFLPTFTALAGGVEPTDRIIDGKDISSLILGTENASPHETFFYYRCDDLEAVRHGDWKLFLQRWDGTIKSERKVCELYNLKNDISETNNVADLYPNIVKELQTIADECRQDLGDGTIPGANCRPIGRVEHGKTLTEFNPDHPYIEAMYDLSDSG